MRIFAKKAFRFAQREMKDGVQVVTKEVTTKPMTFDTVPDWVANDPMFKWAKADGDIEVIQSAADERSAEQKAADKKAAAEQKAAEKAAAEAQKAADKKAAAEQSGGGGNETPQNSPDNQDPSAK